MENQVLTPHVYWAQRHRELYLRVELSDVQVKAGSGRRDEPGHRSPGDHPGPPSSLSGCARESLRCADWIRDAVRSRRPGPGRGSPSSGSSRRPRVQGAILRAAGTCLRESCAGLGGRPGPPLCSQSAA